MQNRNTILRAALGLLALIGLLIHHPPISQAQNWTRLGEGEQDGGVVPDVQTLTVSGTDVVWAASMGTGIFRNEWDDQTGWNNDNGWDEYLPGKGFFGVDAIAVTSGATTTEYVLGATGSFGILYQSATGGNFSLTGWGWPNPDYYPINCDYAFVHDVAFYYENGGYADPPASKYLAAFRVANEDLGSPPPGVYRWYGTAQTPHFTRIDGSGTEVERDFTYFFRDKADKNVLYVLGKQDPLLPPYGQSILLYRISGSYGDPDFVEMDIAHLYDQNYYTDVVYHLSQWDAGSGVVYTYILLQYHDNADNKKIGVFVTHDPLTPTATLTLIYDTEFQVILGKQTPCVVGRPHGNYHYLWLACGLYGMFFYDTAPTQCTLTQITGITDPGSAPESGDLMRWNPRSMVMDIQNHITGNEQMRLFYGTHHHGLWYLDSSLSGSTWTHPWTHLNKKFYANQNRDLHLLQTGGAAPDVLVPAILCGMYKYTGTWSPLEISGWVARPACMAWLAISKANNP